MKRPIFSTIKEKRDKYQKGHNKIKGFKVCCNVTGTTTIR